MTPVRATLPPPPPPPLVIPPSHAKPGRAGGNGWKVFALILLVLLLLSGALNFGHLLFSGLEMAASTTHSMNGPRFVETVVQPGSSGKKIVVIELSGIISSFSDGMGFSMPELVEYQLKHAAEDDDVRGILLKVNSPGGEVMAADDIYRSLVNFQKKTKKPIVAAMGSLAASGGYYVSAPCQWIVANELTITGSIGVIMQGYNYRGVMDKIGIKPQVFKSGKFKDMMSGSKEEKDILPEEKQMVQDMVNETFERFKTIIAEGRNLAKEKNDTQGRALAENWREYADGRILSGKKAEEYGFVDEIGDFRTAVDRVKSIANAPSATLIQYQIPFELGNIFRLLGKTDVKSVKLDLGVEMPKLQAGHMYFLYAPGL